MKRSDKVLTYAIGISVVAHLIAFGVIGRTSASRLAVTSVSEPSHLIDVKLVDNSQPLPVQRVSMRTIPPKPDLSEPIPTRVADFRQPPIDSRFAAVSPTQNRAIRSSAPSNRMPGNPGGRLNTGSVSAHGDLGGSWQGGRTPSGWVPGAEDGTGKGSGRGSGEGRPEPVANASEGPGREPAPAIAVAPRRVSLKICDASGMVAGEYCTSTHNESFNEGSEPSSICNRCRAPEHKSRLADQEKPVLTRDSRVSVPSSADEGMSFNVTVEYTVNTEGGVSGINVIKSSGNRAVDRAVTSAVADLRYKPAVQDGVARSVKMTRTYKINT